MRELPYRQIHLDFHTSPFIDGVGSNFEAEAFIRTLKDANVNSINIFAKCHHGMCYYPTKIGTVHPHLTFDLFGEMVKACRKEEIGVVAYYTVGWEEDAAEKHPEWQQVDRRGVLGGKTPFETGYYRWKSMCHNNEEYVQYILAQTNEIMENYDVDGFWYDIVFQIGCVCAACRRSMAELGLDPMNEQDVLKNDFISLKRFREKVTGFIHAKHPEMLIYYNTGYHPDIAYSAYSIVEKMENNTHIEIESLPSGRWGYNHFPLVVNYHNAAAQSHELVGMTGKFHKSWGDFGTLKNKAALEFECFRMIANGAKCSVGDQMHPSGRLDPTVYKLIGEVYQSIREKEPWCVNSRKIAEIGVITANKDLTHRAEMNDSDEGIMRMLMELHQPFDFINSRTDLSPYKLIILPDDVYLSRALAQRIETYVAQGGKLILSDRSGLNLEQTAFASEIFGVDYRGEAAFAPEYVRLREYFRGKIDPMDYCFYQKGTRVEALPGTEVLGEIVEPYFNRTYDRFCSHCQTPPSRLTHIPAIVRNRDVIYISAPIFRDYTISGVKVYRDILKNCMDLLYRDQLIISDLPTTAEVTVRQQQDRYVLHVVHYVPQKRSKEVEIVEDVIPLYNRTIRMKLPHKPSNVYTAPEVKALEFIYEDGYAEVTIPEIMGHQMVIFE